MSCLKLLDYNYVFDSSVELTASTADTSFPVSNLRKFQRGRVWRTTSSTAQSLVIDLKTAEEINMAVIVFEKDSQVSFQPNQTLKIQANATNVWTAPAVDVSLSLDEDAGVLSYFWATAQEYRYWRLYMDDQYNGYSYFEVPKLFLGKGTELTQPPSIGFKFKEKDQSKITDTEYGVEYSDVYPGRRYMSFDFRALSDADRFTMRKIYERLGKVKPLLSVLDPDEDTFIDKDEYILYAYLNNDYDAVQEFYTYFNMSIDLRECL